jgi:tetratricopeptide (TPR) repeat protein
MRKLAVSHCATLLLIGSSALHVDVARAQGQPTQQGARVLAPQAAPLSQTLPAPPKAAEKAATESTTQSAAAPAQSDAGPSDAVRAKYEQAFNESLEKPADPDVLVNFAEAAVEFGDIEGAISALERLLLIDGSQMEVKLELGVLYYRLGSTEVARAYLQDVSSSKDSADDVKERANTFLKEMKQP